MVDSDNIAIKVTDVNKTFKLPHEKQNSIKGAFINIFRQKKTYEKQKALQDISFEIKKGEFFGIVGRNGSGKSTLLKLLAGIYSPDSGHIQINGRLTPFIELGVGFNPELTGRENVYLNGALLGFNRKEMLDMYDEIVRFAELEKFMDQKLKNYSSGMQVRLAFSIAIRAESDILLIDEVLAVGDTIFQQKCYDYFRQLKREKKTVILVSHDTAALQEYCDRAILINDGKLICEGKTSKVTRNYIDLLNEKEAAQVGVETKKSAQEKVRWGTGDITVEKLQVTSSESKQKRKCFTEDDKNIVINATFQAKVDTERPVYGLTITDTTGRSIFASNTLLEKIETKTLVKGDSVGVIWIVPNIFNNGDFLVSPAVANRLGSVIYDWREAMVTIRVNKELQSAGSVNVGKTITII